MSRQTQHHHVGVILMRSEGRSVLHNTWVYLKYLSFCVVILCVFTFCVPCCDVRYDFQLFVGGLMSYLHYLCLFAYSGAQYILCCVFVLCLRLVFPKLPVSLDCPETQHLDFNNHSANHISYLIVHFGLQKGRDMTWKLSFQLDVIT
jgi:hypothetical protein